MKLSKFIRLFFLLIILLPSIARAAVFSFNPEAVQVAPGDTVIFKVKIDNEGQCLNAFELSVRFPTDILEFLDFGSGESMISIWIEKPTADMSGEINRLGTIKLTGGVPGGYCGKIPGDPGDSDLLGEIIFKIKDGVLSEVSKDFSGIEFAPGAKALISDGRGTEANVVLKSASIIISDRSGVDKEEWNERIKSDKIPPEPFVVELYSDPEMYGGDYYIIFSTTDKQTGVDRYEVLEEKIKKERWWQVIWHKIIPKKGPIWSMAQMPYRLNDQTLRSVIKVKAVDKAGNERVVEYSPDQSAAKVKIANSVKDKLYYYKYYIIALAVFIAALAIILIAKKKRQKNNP